MAFAASKTAPAARSLGSRWHWFNRAPAVRSPAALAQQGGPARRPPAPRASDDDAAPAGMTSDDAYKILGVASGASFDQILAAKNSILAGCKGDQEKMMEVRASRIAAPAGPARPRAS
jgi:hypothetical protein